MENEKFLQIENLTVEYVTKDETVYAVNDVSFSVAKGHTLGLVGETGAGKTTIAQAVLNLLPVPPAEIKSGKVILDGIDILHQTPSEMCKIRGNKVTMIFQDPMTALNPVITIGNQIAEVISYHNDVSKHEARKRAEEMLETVGIPKERYDEYPHQFSGGMKQRVVIAIALACNPELLLADEPTTALDVTIQAQVLELMKKLHEEKNTTTIFITHDLGVIAEMCDEVCVVYSGEIVESGSKEDIFDRAKHPYTNGLFNALPRIGNKVHRLKPIAGMTPDPTHLPEGCKFNPRCPYATEECKIGTVELAEIEPGHFCRCRRVSELEARNV